MKKQFKISGLAIVAGILLASTAFAGNGSGYNGPDLNPTSIPVELDRGISLDQVQAAIVTCMVSGDPSRGLVSTGAALATQMGITPDPVQYGSAQLETSTTTIPGQSQPVNSFGYSVTETGTYAQNQPAPQATPELNIMQGTMGPTSQSLYIQLPRPSSEMGVETALQTTDVFPFVTYTQVVQAPGYDAFGNAIVGQTVVNGLAIQTSPNFAQNGAAMPLTNLVTNHLSAFTVNAQQYVQCLQSELQLQANAQPATPTPAATK